MESYRKPDAYYEDEYDRHTINELKALQKQQEDKLNTIASKEERARTRISLSITFRDTGIRLARSRTSTIRGLQEADERRDRLVRQHPTPCQIKCNECNAEMLFSGHMFDVKKIPLLFVFDCPHGHFPRKVVYPNGDEYVFPKSVCERCGGELLSTTEKKSNQLIFTDTCTACGKVHILDLDLTDLPKTPINETDRKTYCTDLIGKRTFLEDLEAISKFMESLDKHSEKKRLKEEYDVEKIEKHNIPQLEQRLSKMTNEIGYIKFEFDKPIIKQHVIVPFNAQDPTERSEKESIKLISKKLKACLFKTNWRLMGKIDYRLGHLTGRLKAYEQEDDLLKIAKEISANSQVDN